MIIKRVDRTVFSLQRDPDSEKPREFQVSPTHRVGEWETNRQRMRYRDGKSRVKQRIVRAPFGRENYSVDPFHTPGKEIEGATKR